MIRARIENKLVQADEIYKQINWTKIVTIFISSFAWGIIAHGFMLFNKFSWGDDIANLFSFGTTYELGRWMLETLRSIFVFFFAANYSQPFVNGMGVFVCVGITACILANMFRIKRTSSLIALTAVMVTTPTILGMFTFMFTSFAYMIGLVLCISGVWLVCKTKMNLCSFIAGCLLIACAMGTYQAWFPMALSVFVLFFFTEVLSANSYNWGAYIKKGIYYFSACLGSLVMYLGINQYFIDSKQIVMNNHAGMDTYGLVSIGEYMERVKYAYRMFFRPDRGFYPSFISKIYKLLLLCIIILVIRQFIKCFQRNVASMIQALLLIIVFPLTVCFIYVLAGNAYTLVLYPYIMVYLLFIWLIEKEWDEKNIFSIWQERLGILLVLCMCIWLARCSNISYLEANLLQERAKSYYTTMITRIQSVDGYSEDLEIAYVNAHQNLSLDTVTIIDFEGALMVPHTFLHDYSWKMFVQIWCGFSQQEVTGDRLVEIESMEKVQNMPSYPNQGSIEVIDGIIVVKLAEE